MSWALVKWIEEDRISVIPSTRVIERSPLPDAGFPRLFERLCSARAVNLCSYHCNTSFFPLQNIVR